MKFSMIAILSLLSMTKVYADDYKAFWRCTDGHLEAIEKQAVLNDEKVDLFINYIQAVSTTLRSAPISLKSVVDLPSHFNQDNFVSLGLKDQWFLNCVGQVVLNPNYPEGKLVFDVKRNSYSCPLIPESCNK